MADSPPKGFNYIIETCRTIYREEGSRAFFRGLSATCKFLSAVQYLLVSDSKSSSSWQQIYERMLFLEFPDFVNPSLLKLTFHFPLQNPCCSLDSACSTISLSRINADLCTVVFQFVAFELCIEFLQKHTDL